MGTPCKEQFNDLLRSAGPHPMVRPTQGAGGRAPPPALAISIQIHASQPTTAFQHRWGEEPEAAMDAAAVATAAMATKDIEGVEVKRRVTAGMSAKDVATGLEDGEDVAVELVAAVFEEVFKQAERALADAATLAAMELERQAQQQLEERNAQIELTGEPTVEDETATTAIPVMRGTDADEMGPT